LPTSRPTAVPTINRGWYEIGVLLTAAVVTTPGNGYINFTTQNITCLGTQPNGAPCWIKKVRADVYYNDVDGGVSTVPLDHRWIYNDTNGAYKLETLQPIVFFSPVINFAPWIVAPDDPPGLDGYFSILLTYYHDADGLATYLERRFRPMNESAGLCFFVNENSLTCSPTPDASVVAPTSSPILSGSTMIYVIAGGAAMAAIILVGAAWVRARKRRSRAASADAMAAGATSTTGGAEGPDMSFAESPSV